MAVPHLSHLVGLASPQMSTPTALRGPCSWGDEAGVLTASGATSLVASCRLKPHNMGATRPVSGSGKYKYKCGCVNGVPHDTSLRVEGVTGHAQLSPLKCVQSGFIVLMHTSQR